MTNRQPRQVQAHMWPTLLLAVNLLLFNNLLCLLRESWPLRRRLPERGSKRLRLPQRVRWAVLPWVRLLIHNKWSWTEKVSLSLMGERDNHRWGIPPIVGRLVPMLQIRVALICLLPSSSKPWLNSKRFSCRRSSNNRIWAQMKYTNWNKKWWTNNCSSKLTYFVSNQFKLSLWILNQTWLEKWN